MKPLPKHLRRELREKTAQAHEAALRRALEPLADSFDAWRAGTLDSGELSDRIHAFHQGPARKLFSFYTGDIPEIAVAHALVTGLLPRTTVSAELQQAIGNAIEFCESQEREE